MYNTGIDIKGVFMKRVIYTLTAIFSAVAAAVLIIEPIAAIERSGYFFFDSSPFPEIIAILALGILSIVQLKKHTPRIMLILCGCVFFESVHTIDCRYLFGLLLMAAALTPAVYELSRYGMAARQEPVMREKRRRLLIAAIPLALALAAYRVMLSIMQSVIIEYDYFFYPFGDVIYYPSGIIGILALLFAAAFCASMNRRTSALYRMFIAGFIVSDALGTFLLYYNTIFLRSYLPDTAVKMFILFEIVYALFILLISLHSSMTKRGSLLPQDAPDMTEQAFNNSIKEG
jgi:hypothetical protein